MGNGNGAATKAVVKFGDRGLQPETLEGAYRVAKVVSDSGLAPKGMQRPTAIIVAMSMGAEIGLTTMQSLQTIAVINGRPSIFGDAALALALGSGLVDPLEEFFEGEGDEFEAVCRCRRHGVERWHEVRFGVRDARKAGLWGKAGPWSQYPKRMLQMRARSFALRDVCPDVLRGLSIAEEARDIPAEPEPLPTAFEVVQDAPAVAALPEPVPEQPVRQQPAPVAVQSAPVTF